MPASPATHMTYEEFVALARERFGDNPLDWAFQCPACGDVASGHDFKAALDDHPRTRIPRGSDTEETVTATDVLGQECIGRTLGSLAVASTEDWKGRGCDWVAYGLFRGPMFVTREDHEIATFRLAEPVTEKEKP